MGASFEPDCLQHRGHRPPSTHLWRIEEAAVRETPGVDRGEGGRTIGGRTKRFDGKFMVFSGGAPRCEERRKMKWFNLVLLSFCFGPVEGGNPDLVTFRGFFNYEN